MNPGRWGRALADYLRSELNSRNLPGGEPYAEDWGWAVPIDNEQFPLWVGCGNYEEYDDGFLCFIEPSKPFVRKWLSKVDTSPTVERLASALEAALRQRDDVSRLRWWSDDEART